MQYFDKRWFSWDDFDKILNPVALKSTQNGNCLYNLISTMKCVSEALLELLCLLTSIEKAASYVDHEALINASPGVKKKIGTTISRYCSNWKRAEILVWDLWLDVSYSSKSHCN